MITVDRAKLHNGGLILEKEFGALAKNIIFEDEDTLEVKYGELYDLIPEKDISGTRQKYIGTATTKDVSPSGDAKSKQVVLGNDSRLHEIVASTSDPNTSYGDNGTFWFKINE